MSKRPSPLPLVVGAWIGACGLGMWQLFAHAATPIAIVAVPERLPGAAAAAMHWPGQRPLLVIAAHPQCPWLPGTLDALSLALTDNPDIDLRVLVYRPSVQPPAWDEQAFAILCQGLPADTTIVDRDGLLARAIGAERSGHVGLYDRTGRLTFAGGITDVRDQNGDHAAMPALRRALTDPASIAATLRTPVSGCPLTTAAAPPR